MSAGRSAKDVICGSAIHAVGEFDHENIVRRDLEPVFDVAPKVEGAVLYELLTAL